MSCSHMLKSRLPVSKLSSKIKSPLQIFFSFAALIPLMVVTLFSHFVIAPRTTAELMESTATRVMRTFCTIVGESLSSFFIHCCTVQSRKEFNEKWWKHHKRHQVFIDREFYEVLWCDGKRVSERSCLMFMKIY